MYLFFKLHKDFGSSLCPVIRTIISNIILFCFPPHTLVTFNNGCIINQEDPHKMHKKNNVFVVFLSVDCFMK